jgi:hypothetical protein
VPTDLPLQRADDARAVELAREVLLDPGRVHALAQELHCGSTTRERSAARASARLARERPELLQPIVRRLTRVANAVEDREIKEALADALPRLELGSGEAGRLAFVFESWLEDGDPELQRTAMDAMVALVPQRPRLARRIRSVIEARAALGSPTAARYGMTLLERLKEF